jgi:hypothetical protein
MHASRLFVAISLAAALAACSRSQPQPDKELVRALDLGLGTTPGAVVSQVELGAEAEAKPRAAARPSHVRAVSRVAARPAITEAAPAPQPAEDQPEATEETVAMAPAPEPEVAPAPEPEPTPEPQPRQNGRFGGTFPGRTDDIPLPGEGVYRIPGIAGPVIIRGGGGSGADPCVVHGPRGRGGFDGVPIHPRAPTSGDGRGGFGGGGFGGGRGGRFGGR